MAWTRAFWTGAERGFLTVASFGIIATVVVLLALMASLIPVFRATRLDPVAALRHE
jgi:ABC-type antimicrobial peptide transport system permease subunit